MEGDIAKFSVDKKHNLVANCIEVNFFIRDKHYPVYFKSKEKILMENNEAFVSCALLASMAEQVDIIVNGDLSEKFLKASYTIQDSFFFLETFTSKDKP